jgi:hypothetical protein
VPVRGGLAWLPPRFATGPHDNVPMTAFDYMFTEDVLFIAMDSLSLGVSPDGERFEHAFFTKVFPLPHVQCVMCGTGSMPLVLQWFLTIQSRVVTDTILYLDSLAPQKLPELNLEHGGGVPSTIYHFGVHPTTKKLCGFAYRSTSEFRSEAFEVPRFGIKPPSSNAAERFEKVLDTGTVTSATFVEMIRDQRAEDDALPSHERVGIGGEIHLFRMTPDTQALWTCHRFDDYDEVLARMIRNCEDR